jgi:hypothetical protein
MASLQVKASAKKVKFWSTPNHNKVLDGKNFSYVFLRYIKSDENFEAFLVSGAEVKKTRRMPNTTGKKAGKSFHISKCTRKTKQITGKTGWSLSSERNAEKRIP